MIVDYNCRGYRAVISASIRKPLTLIQGYLVPGSMPADFLIGKSGIVAGKRCKNYKGPLEEPARIPYQVTLIDTSLTPSLRISVFFNIPSKFFKQGLL